MSESLKVGDRVRVTARNLVDGYKPGDKGTVLRVGESKAARAHYYYVAMDKDDPAHSVPVFGEGEIERDGEG